MYSAFITGTVAGSGNITVETSSVPTAVITPQDIHINVIDVTVLTVQFVIDITASSAITPHPTVGTTGSVIT